MSNKEKLWLKIKLVKEDREAILSVACSLPSKDRDILIKAIVKARDKNIKLNPLVDFLNDKELSFLANQEWDIGNIEFDIHRGQIIQYLNDKKKDGSSIDDARKDRWPYVPNYVIGQVFFNLHLEGLIVPIKYEGNKGGYVLKKYFNTHVQKDDSYTSPTNKIVKSVSITKADGKKLRKVIISKASKKDICEAGFKPEFIATLDDKEKDYFNTLSNLQIKIMRTEVSKA